MKICVAGACGRMGARILEMASKDEEIEVGALVDTPANEGRYITYGYESNRIIRRRVRSSLVLALRKSDVLIDFTAPAAALLNAKAAAMLQKPAVIGTTGLTANSIRILKTFSKTIPVVWSPNMSIGVNILFKITKELAEYLPSDIYNREVLEIHHNQKKDSPSGTAIRLANVLSESMESPTMLHGREGLIGKRPEQEIGMHSIRGGDVIGEHTVYFIGPGERVELTHRSSTRDHYAIGALVAAKFAMTAKPGLYDMQDVLGLK